MCFPWFYLQIIKVHGTGIKIQNYDYRLHLDKVGAQLWALVNRAVLREGRAGWLFLVLLTDMSARMCELICLNKHVILRISCESVKLENIQNWKGNITKI